MSKTRNSIGPIDSRIHTPAPNKPEVRKELSISRISPARAGAIGALATITPVLLMGAAELHDSGEDKTKVEVDVSNQEPGSSLHISTGDERIDAFNASQNIADPTNPDPVAREASQQEARDALRFQGD